MPKVKLLSFLCALLMSIGMQAHDLEPLHVDGRYLKNPAGDIVTLHGYMTSLESWFQAEDFKFDNYDFQTATINKKAAIDSVLATGWKMDYVRFIFPEYYCFDKGDGYKGFNLGLFKKYLDEFCLPLIDYFHEKGIYTILLPPTSSPILIGYGDEFQQFLLLLWDYISSHPRIRNNPGIMFELANEPVNFSCKYSCYDGLGSYTLNSRTPFKEVKDYWQPIVDKIRSHCNNIVYVPGMQWQSDFTGFADYPVMGDNIGYAIHWYPGWWGNMRKDWEEHVFPVAYMAPFVMTETGWGIYDAIEGTTTNFGNPLKEIVDDLGNVSWNCWVTYEDYYYLVNDETSENERATIANDPEVYYKPLYQWWNDYAHTKVMPTNQLKAKSVSFNDFPTTVSPGKYWLAKIKAEFSNGLSWDVSGDAEYTVSDESVLTIKNGVIRAWKEGTVTVGVTYTDGTGQTFSRQFSITSTLFPLTNQGFNPDITTDGNSFDELNGTFSSETWTFGGWTYGERLDLSSYQYLVFQLHEPPQYGASVHIWDNDLWWDENGGWSSACDPVSGQPGFDFGGSTELVINLQELKNKSGQPLDLGHIGGVAIFVYSGTVRIKKVFLSNDGTTPAPYVGEPVVVYADNKTIYYGDEVPELTYSVVGNALLQTPTLSTTVTKASTVGMYDISIDGNEDNVHYYPGNLHVIPAPLTVSAGTHSLVEGEMIPVITPIYDGLKNEETEETAFVVKPTTQPMLSGWAIAGSYPIYLNSNGKTNGNYVLDYSQTTGILTVKESEDIKKYGIDLTARVGISQEDWHAWGATDTIYAPAVTTSDGRQAQMMEVWTESPADKTGEIMYQTISGLDNGEYLVGIYANARKNTHIQGFDFEEGANDMVYVAANDVRVYIPAYTEDVLIFGNGVCGIRTKVTDGTLRISMVAEKLGTHWHTIQIKKLIKLPETTVTAENKTMVYGDEVPELTYTTDGPALDGTPQLTTTATSASPVGTYPITVERGTETNERVVYVAGTLTITKAPLTVGAKDETITEGDAIPTFTLTYDGFRNNDNEATAFTTKPRATTTATSSSPAGSYPIKVSGGKAKNYELSYEQGTLTIVASAAPQDEDLTARVSTSQEAWNAWGVCATEFAPAITTNDGRQAQMMETYEETTETTGEMMHQTVSGLENGDYAVELYANAQYTDGRGFASDLKDGATDVVYVSANERRCYVKAHIGTAVSENGVYTVYAHVTDGILRLGLTAEKPGTNWHTIQIKKLTLLRLGTVIYADDKTREQGQDNPKWTYVVSGADITGQPLAAMSLELAKAQPKATCPYICSPVC